MKTLLCIFDYIIMKIVSYFSDIVTDSFQMLVFSAF